MRLFIIFPYYHFNALGFAWFSLFHFWAWDSWKKWSRTKPPCLSPHPPVTTESPGMGGRVWMCGFDSCSGNSCAARIESLWRRGRRDKLYLLVVWADLPEGREGGSERVEKDTGPLSEHRVCMENIRPVALMGLWVWCGPWVDLQVWRAFCTWQILEPVKNRKESSWPRDKECQAT